MKPFYYIKPILMIYCIIMLVLSLDAQSPYAITYFTLCIIATAHLISIETPKYND